MSRVGMRPQPRISLAAIASTASINSDGRLETFVLATNGSVWHIWQTVPHAGPWSRISGLGGIVKAPVCQALNSDGRLEVFGIASDGDLYNSWQTLAGSLPDITTWSDWNKLT